MQIKKYFIPENLDLAKLEECGRAEYVEKLLRFTSMLQYRRYRDCRLKIDDFIPLKAHILGEYIRPNDVKRVRDDLVQLGIIECDGEWIRRKKCLGHRFTEEFRGEKMCSVKAEYPKGKIDAPRNFRKPHDFIFQNLKRVTIEPAARAALENIYGNDEREANDTYNYRLTAFEMISDGTWFFASDRKTGRVFHNVSNCPREMRPYLRLDGREMVEIDISNCQPLLLACLYSEPHSAEARRYREVVESGGFYEVMRERTGYSRNEAKSQFLTFAFGPSEWRGRFEQEFTALFPKLRSDIDGMKAADYRDMALFTQKLEANLMINSVVPICEREGIPVLTIHDSLMIYPEHSEEMQALIKMECERLYRLSPNVKMK